MSPTAAIVIRLLERGGGAGGEAGGGTGSITGSGSTDSVSGDGATGGSGGGAVAQAATAKGSNKRRRLITQPDSQYVDSRLAEPAANPVELVQVIRRSDPNPMIGPVVDNYSLHAGFDAKQCKFGPAAIGITGFGE